MFFVDLEVGVGSEQNGYRPILVISNNTGNKYSSTVIAAVVTSHTTSRSNIPIHCYIEAQQGLEYDSLVLLEQIQTIDKLRLNEYIGTLSDKTIREVDKALAVSVGLKN